MPYYNKGDRHTYKRSRSRSPPRQGRYAPTSKSRLSRSQSRSVTPQHTTTGRRDEQRGRRVPYFEKRQSYSKSPVRRGGRNRSRSRTPQRRRETRRRNSVSKSPPVKTSKKYDEYPGSKSPPRKSERNDSHGRRSSASGKPDDYHKWKNLRSHSKSPLRVTTRNERQRKSLSPVVHTRSVHKREEESISPATSPTNYAKSGSSRKSSRTAEGRNRSRSPRHTPEVKKHFSGSPRRKSQQKKEDSTKSVRRRRPSSDRSISPPQSSTKDKKQKHVEPKLKHGIPSDEEDRDRTKRFDPPENFTIRLTRVQKEPTPPPPKRAGIDKIYLPRRSSEGWTGLFEREELKGLVHLDYSDRETQEDRRKKGDRRDFAVNRDKKKNETHITNISLSDRWQLLASKLYEESSESRHTVKQKSRSPVHTSRHDSRLVSDRHTKEKAPEMQDLHRSDLRHSIQGEKSANSRVVGRGDLRYSLKNSRRQEDEGLKSSRSQRYGEERRVTTAGIGNISSPGNRRTLSHPSSTRIDKKSEEFSQITRIKGEPERRYASDRQRNAKTELPSFSNRPDKGQIPILELLNPEIIPKGGYYYEHDDRLRQDDWNINQDTFNRGPPGNRWGRGGGRGMRGRGGFRGRGPRGGFRGFGGRGRARSWDRLSVTRRRGSVEQDWKHDKYSEIDEDQKPSSTT